MFLDLPIPYGNTVYYLPLELIIPLIVTSILTAWFWRKARLAKKIHTWILRLHRSGSAEVYSPQRELDTAVEYVDRYGVSQRPFKPNYQYLKVLKEGDEVETPDGVGKITKIIEMKREPVKGDPAKFGNVETKADPFQYEVDIVGQSVHVYSMKSVTLIGEKQNLQKRGSIPSIMPHGWNERIMIHGEGLDELFDWARVWEGQDESQVREGGAARLLKEGADIFASLKEKIRASFREIWWLWIMVLIIGMTVGMILGGKWLHIQ